MSALHTGVPLGLAAGTIVCVALLLSSNGTTGPEEPHEDVSNVVSSRPRTPSSSRMHANIVAASAVSSDTAAGAVPSIAVAADTRRFSQAWVAPRNFRLGEMSKAALGDEASFGMLVRRPMDIVVPWAPPAATVGHGGAPVAMPWRYDAGYVVGRAIAARLRWIRTLYFAVSTTAAAAAADPPWLSELRALAPFEVLVVRDTDYVPPRCRQAAASAVGAAWLPGEPWLDTIAGLSPTALYLGPGALPVTVMHPDVFVAYGAVASVSPAALAEASAIRSQLDAGLTPQSVSPTQRRAYELLLRHKGSSRGNGGPTAQLDDIVFSGHDGHGGCGVTILRHDAGEELREVLGVSDSCSNVDFAEVARDVDVRMLLDNLGSESRQMPTDAPPQRKHLQCATYTLNAGEWQERLRQVRGFVDFSHALRPGAVTLLQYRDALASMAHLAGLGKPEREALLHDWSAEPLGAGGHV